jgi:hypothetical protein
MAIALSLIVVLAIIAVVVRWRARRHHDPAKDIERSRKWRRSSGPG